ncbi:MAG: protein arginine kinase [Planctomycetes bacterium]|nr:protein arginine kinase [Planctomycetota bacterium]
MSGPAPLGEWLRGTGPDAEVSICTRVRLARNVQGYRFPTRMTSEEAAEVDRFVCSRLTSAETGLDLSVVHLHDVPKIDRQVLIERHLISRELAGADRARSVAVDDDECISIMVNEEDHIRAQVFHSGFQVEATYRDALRIDEAVLRVIPIAFSEEFGFLTSCPTNTGTGMRISAMLHLPGLVWADDIERASNTAQKIHLAVRGLYGEGSRALGDFYQVSNQVTLGRSDEQIVEDVRVAVARIIAWEREVRAALLDGDARARTLDRVFRSLGVLQNARILTSDECLGCLSAVRFGVVQGLLPDLTVEQVNRVLMHAQPGHLQQFANAELTAVERDRRRADSVREILTRSHG